MLSIGKNKLAVDPTLSASYFNPKSGLEISSSLGVTFNANNDATDYKTPDELHFENTLAHHFKNDLTLGVIGYYYQQLGRRASSA